MSKVALAISAVAFSACLSAAPALAAPGDNDLRPVAAALMTGNYVGAEAQIAADKASSQDPAMLINLGNAYAGMGRRADAQLAYRAALGIPDEELDLADGTVRSSHQVATSALRQLGVGYASR
jgi:hypothetical protein